MITSDKHMCVFFACWILSVYIRDFVFFFLLPPEVMVKVHVVDLKTESVAPPISVRAYLNQTVSEFKQLISKVIYSPQGLVLKSFHSLSLWKCVIIYVPKMRACTFCGWCCEFCPAGFSSMLQLSVSICSFLLKAAVCFLLPSRVLSQLLHKLSHSLAILLTSLLNKNFCGKAEESK